MCDYCDRFESPALRTCPFRDDVEQRANQAILQRLESDLHRLAWEGAGGWPVDGPAPATPAPPPRDGTSLATAISAVHGSRRDHLRFVPRLIQKPSV